MEAAENDAAFVERRKAGFQPAAGFHPANAQGKPPAPPCRPRLLQSNGAHLIDVPHPIKRRGEPPPDLRPGHPSKRSIGREPPFACEEKAAPIARKSRPRLGAPAVDRSAAIASWRPRTILAEADVQIAVRVLAVDPNHLILAPAGREHQGALVGR